MKICIVTVYDSINSGSFWQAHTLGQELRMQGHEVYYYKRKTNGASSSLSAKIKTIAQMLSRRQLAEAVNYIQKLRLFNKANKDFVVIDSTCPSYKEIDCFILGSDTIWDLSSNYFRKHKAVFWGDVFHGRKVISYGGSIANSDAHLLDDNYYSYNIKHWNAISVRDTHTLNALSRLTNQTIHLVCDPTLLLTESYYKDICQVQTGNYIFLYVFKKLKSNQDKQLREFADKNNLKIICGTKRKTSNEIDELVINGPYNFMKHMLGAKYIITDTYHGTIFSTNFNKQFVVINHNFIKINDFLSLVGLTNRIVDEDSNLLNTIATPIDYGHANKIIEEMRQYSIAFLKNNLK